MSEPKLITAAKAHTEAEVADLEPQADIMPHLLWLGRYGMGLLPMYMMNDDTKDSLAETMTASLVVGRATEAVFVSDVWMAAYDRDDPAVDAAAGTAEIPPSQHPDRQELVMLMYHSRREVLMVSAPVTRYPDKAPTLGEWETHPQSHPKFRTPSGRFGNAVNWGLHMAAEMPAEMAAMIDAGWAAGQQQDLIERFMKVQHSFIHPGAPPMRFEVEVERINDEEPSPGQVIEGLFGTDPDQAS